MVGECFEKSSDLGDVGVDVVDVLGDVLVRVLLGDGFVNLLRKLLQSCGSICNLILVLLDNWNHLNLLRLIQKVIFSQSFKTTNLEIRKSLLLFSETLKLLVEILNDLLISINMKHLLKESKTIINGHQFLLEVSDFLCSQGNINWNSAIV